MTTAAGLPAYEISNHAADGHECRHNQPIGKRDWIGVGPGRNFYGRFAIF